MTFRDQAIEFGKLLLRKYESIPEYSSAEGVRNITVDNQKYTIVVTVHWDVEIPFFNYLIKDGIREVQSETLIPLR